MLTGCTATNQADGVSPVPSARPPAAPEAPVAPPLGLAPLATPQQVVRAVPMGRLDPFASPQSDGTLSAVVPAEARSTPLQAPQGFRLTGVVRSGGRAEAVVLYGSRSGSLFLGDQGGRNTDLLPAGWRVAAIDSSQGSLTLAHGPQRLRFSL